MSHRFVLQKPASKTAQVFVHQAEQLIGVARLTGCASAQKFCDRWHRVSQVGDELRGVCMQRVRCGGTHLPLGYPRSLDRAIQGPTKLRREPLSDCRLATRTVAA